MAGLNLCGTCSGLIPARYDKDNCKIVQRPFGSDRMIGFHCSVEFTDIKDTAEDGEWETLITAGKIVLSPFFGSFRTGTPTSESFEDGLGRTYPDVTTVPWTFTTPSVAADYDDQEWFYAFHQQMQYYTWAYFDANGRIALNDTVVTAILASGASAVPVESNPGFRFSLNTIPDFRELNGAGKAGQWYAEGSFLTDSVIRVVAIPGLTTLLNGLA